MAGTAFCDVPALENRIQQRTGWRVRGLAIEIHPERAVLRGQATTSLVRQLAQQMVTDCLPELFVENGIGVDHPVEVLPGVPMS